MSSRYPPLLSIIVVTLSLLLQPALAFSCPQKTMVDDLSAHAAMMDHDMPLDMTLGKPLDTSLDMPHHMSQNMADCCGGSGDGEHCPMQACLAGAALPSAFNLPGFSPAITLPTTAKAGAMVLIASTLQRPPISS